jgi:hypothetical protein
MNTQFRCSKRIVPLLAGVLFTFALCVITISIRNGTADERGWTQLPAGCDMVALPPSGEFPPPANPVLSPNPVCIPLSSAAVLRNI